jgi:predicted RNase H-like HicB family nuclease
MSIFRLLFPQKNPNAVRSEHNIPDTIGWSIQLTKDGLVATSKDLPGLVTNAKNPEELLEMMNDAVLEYFNVSKFDSDYIFDSLNLEGKGTIYLKNAEAKKQYA